jgi:hypothetical protein
MPIHDWTRVNAGTFHHFHVSWIAEISRVLNTSVLPDDYYAMAEQVAGNIGPDVLTLQVTPSRKSPRPAASNGGVAVAAAVVTAPPQVHFVETTEEDLYARKRKRLVIRHSSNDRIVALVEIVSPGNKASRHAFRSFVRKAAGALRQGIHLLAIDLHPPTPRDPQGLHPAIWAEFADSTFTLPADKPFTLVSYAVEGAVKRAFVESAAVGDALPSMPLFLTPEAHVLVPLDATYRSAFDAVPRRWSEVLEGAG